MKPDKILRKLVEGSYKEYGGNIYNYAYYSTYSRSDAEDITQEAFLKYAQALHKGTQIENPQAYLYRTVRNLSVNLARRKGKEIGEAEFPIDIVEDEKLYSDPERASMLADQREQVLKATQALSEEQRTALILKEIEGMDYEEIAEVMASNPNAVGSLLTRGRLRFREAFRMSQIDMDNIEEECKTYLPMLSQYIDDKLSDNERSLVDLHLKKCPFCRLALEEMQESAESYRALVPLIPIAGLGAAISKGVSGASSVAGATACAITSTATTTAASAGLSLVSKIAIGVAGCLIVAGGTVGGILGVKISNDNRKEEEQKQLALSAIEEGEALINRLDEEKMRLFDETEIKYDTVVEVLNTAMIDYEAAEYEGIPERIEEGITSKVSLLKKEANVRKGLASIESDYQSAQGELNAVGIIECEQSQNASTLISSDKEALSGEMTKKILDSVKDTFPVIQEYVNQMLSLAEQERQRIAAEEAARNAYPDTPFGVVEASFFAFYNKDYMEYRKYITEEVWISMNDAPGGIERIYTDYFKGKSLQRIELDDEQVSDLGSYAYVDIYVYFTDGSKMHNSDIMLEPNASGNWVICR